MDLQKFQAGQLYKSVQACRPKDYTKAIWLTVAAIILAAALVFLAVVLGWKPAQDNSQAKANQVQGLYIFTDCKPVQQYEYLGTVQNGFRMAGSAQYQPVRDRLIKKLQEQFPAANGAIFYLNNGSADKCDAIKFLQ